MTSRRFIVKSNGISSPTLPYFRLHYVWQQEWNVLTRSYPYDHVITVTKTVTEDDVRELVTTPGKSLILLCFP